MAFCSSEDCEKLLQRKDEIEKKIQHLKVTVEVKTGYGNEVTLPMITQKHRQPESHVLIINLSNSL